jgi:mono/diheme cytochrome c family protein
MMNTPYRAILLLLLSSPFTALAADVIQGKILYQSTCLRCHRDAQAQLKTTPSQIGEVLRNRHIPPHRFVLTGTDLDNLVEYLESRDHIR